MIKPCNPPESPEAMKEAARLREVMQLEARLDTAYTQRNNAAVALVRMALLLGWPAGRGLDDKTDNDLAWRHVVYLDLPNGEQVSYHMAPADVALLDGLPEYTGKWDGKFTGTTAWAQMVPAPAWVTDMDYRPEELGDPDSEPTLTACAICFQGAEACTATGCGFMEAGNGEPGTPSEGVLNLGPGEFDPAEVERLMQGTTESQIVRLDCAAWPTPIYTTPGLQLFGSVPKAAFPPGVCACPKCEQPREAGRLFCRPHRSVDSRFLDLEPLTNERLAYMMQRDGEQQ